MPHGIYWHTSYGVLRVCYFTLRATNKLELEMHSSLNLSLININPLWFKGLTSRTGDGDDDAAYIAAPMANKKVSGYLMHD